VCLLTGAAGVLGTAFCRRHAADYDIAAVYRTTPPEVPSQDQRLIDPLEPGRDPPANEHPVYGIRADLTRSGEIDRIVELVLARFGGVDLLVNGAAHVRLGGIVESRRLLDDAALAFDVNAVIPLKLATALCLACWRDQEEQNRLNNRNVVNVSSMSGLGVYPGWGQSVYSSTKVALNYLTRHMAAEYKTFGVRVNAVAPTSFPRLITTASVADGIVIVDQGRRTGGVLVMDQQGHRWR
jgi:NAD(P)-dependent dehydrogenase (short-subunit alcohol dehydrogenase family)